MARRSDSFFNLFLEEEDPRYAQYLLAHDFVSKNPAQISALVRDEDVKNTILLDFATRGPRLVRLFNLIDSKPATIELAAGIVDILKELLPSLYELVGINGLMDLLLSALRIGLRFQSLALATLADILLGCGNLLERAMSDCHGGELLKRWVCAFQTTVHDTNVWGRWTERLVAMCEYCSSDHGLVLEIQKWKAVALLKTSLREWEAQNSKRPSKSNDLPSLSKMKKLTKDDKKDHGALRRDPIYSPIFAEFDQGILDALSAVDLKAPSSERALRNTIEILEGPKTLSILQTIACTFPCRPCYEAANLSSSASEAQGLSIDVPMTPSAEKAEFGLLGQRVGVWKVLLSPLALKDIQNLSYSGSYADVSLYCAEIFI